MVGKCLPEVGSTVPPPTGMLPVPRVGLEWLGSAPSWVVERVDSRPAGLFLVLVVGFKLDLINPQPSLPLHFYQNELFTSLGNSLLINKDSKGPLSVEFFKFLFLSSPTSALTRRT